MRYYEHSDYDPHTYNKV